MGYFLSIEAFPALLEAIQQQGYTVIAPTVRDHAIVYDEISTINELPIGWADAQAPGSYRLTYQDDARFFGYTVGPQAWKKYLYPSSVRLWQARRANGHLEINNTLPPAPKLALLGVRACELHAIAIQDRIFLEGQFVDPTYKAQREAVLIVAVNCGRAGATCFCASMQTGLQVSAGFDLALTEIYNPDHHFFVIESGSRRGEEILAALALQPASPAEMTAAEATISAAAAEMGRTLATEGLKERLMAAADHPHWEEIAQRCLSCGNCTLVCPTCFCTTVEDVTDLSGEQAERWRKWDSCFTLDFSYIHGGSVRYSPKARYRQWLTHKLSTWVDQFGTFGCVGCGRCITWCPVGIDLTEEARRLSGLAEKEQA